MRSFQLKIADAQAVSTHLNIVVYQVFGGRFIQGE